MLINQNEEYYNVIKKVMFKKTCAMVKNNPQMFEKNKVAGSDLAKKENDVNTFYKQVTLENVIDTKNSFYKI